MNKLFESIDYLFSSNNSVLKEDVEVSLADKPLKDLSKEEFKQLLKEKYPNGFHCETNAGDVELSSDGSWANNSNTPSGEGDLIYPFETYDDFCDYFFADIEDTFGDQTFNDILVFDGKSGMPHFIALEESSDFTDEEKENNNLDDEGYDEFGDEWIHCEWCGEATPKYECKKERNLGWICKGCQNALYSRGEKAVYEEPINESESSARILDFEETGGGVLSYVGEVDNYNFIGDIDGSIEFLDKKWGIDSWEKYCNIEDEAYSEYMSDEPLDSYKYGKDISGTYDFEQKYAEFKPELLPAVADALESFAKSIHNPNYSLRVFDEVERLRSYDGSLDEAESDNSTKDSKVKVSLYGEVTEYNSIEEAIKDMEEALSYCDPNSHEFKRYLSIYYQLKDGKTDCTDELVESTISLIRKGLTEAKSSISPVQAFTNILFATNDDMGSVSELIDYAEALADRCGYKSEDIGDNYSKVIKDCINKIFNDDQDYFKQEVDVLIDNLDEDYLIDIIDQYKDDKLVDCLNVLKSYTSNSGKIDEVISKLGNVNIDIRLMAQEFQRYLHDNYKPWEVLGTTSGPRTYNDLFEIPTDYSVVGADYFNYAGRPNDMLDHIGYGWKQDGDKVIADLIGFSSSTRGSSVVYDQAPVSYGYSAVIDNSNKEEKFKEMANALISKAKDIKSKYKLK